MPAIATGPYIRKISVSPASFIEGWDDLHHIAASTEVRDLEIAFAPGEYVFRGPLVLSNRRIISSSAQGATSFFQATDFCGDSVLNGAKASYLEVKGLHLEGNGVENCVGSAINCDGLGPREIHISACTVKRFARNGIVFRNASKFSIHDVEVLDSGVHGISVAESQNGSIARCRITNARASGVNVSNSQHIYVMSNSITDEHLSPLTYGGVRFSNGCMDCIAQSNVVKNKARGIFILSGSSRTSVSNNILIACRIQGILCETGGNVIKMNQIYLGIAGEGIRAAEGNKVEQNDVFN